ncbi:hypothetical protein [Alteromonas sp. a30]|uniref:hypothetical protein n=1 Tax=Alteromonas sp. a30 TaxID=2730917 RepID=UPI002282BB0F|nr:hypothetical protein [Alteromonas sp. a30]MCY7297213.1 hypothetical protein [Alteromonas sp. a30]
MAKKLKLSAIVLFALVSATPAHASDWFDDFLNSFFKGFEPVVVEEPVIVPLGPGGGGGNPPGPIDPS